MDPESLGEHVLRLTGFVSLADLSHGLFGQFREALSFPFDGGPVLFLVVVVLLFGPPAEVGEVVVESVAVDVPTLHPGWAKSYERHQDQTVNPATSDMAVIVDESHLKVSPCILRRGHVSPSIRKSVAPAVVSESTGLNPAVFTDAVSGETWDEAEFGRGGRIIGGHDEPLARPLCSRHPGDSRSSGCLSIVPKEAMGKQ
jgi:hypothetical protein